MGRALSESDAQISRNFRPFDLMKHVIYQNCVNCDKLVSNGVYSDITLLQLLTKTRKRHRETNKQTTNKSR